MDETEKRRKLARELSNLGGALMDVLYAMDAVRRRAASAGLVFADADFQGQAALAHLSAERVTTGLAAISTVTTAFVNGNFDDVFEALRS